MGFAWWSATEASFLPTAQSLFFYHASGDIKKYSVAFGEQQKLYAGGGDSTIAVSVSPTGFTAREFPFLQRGYCLQRSIREDVIARSPRRFRNEPSLAVPLGS